MIDEASIRFNAQKIQDIMNEEISKTFTNYKYNPNNKKEKIEQVSSKIISRLSDLPDQEYKYISHSILLTKGEQEFETFSLNMWDQNSDAVAYVDYSNGDIRFIMTVWGVKC